MDTSGIGRSTRDLPALTPEMIADPESCWIDVREWFEHSDRPLEIEIGSGKGTFLAQQAGLQTHTNFLGIEYAGEFYRYAADRIRRSSLSNVRMLYGDAVDFLAVRCPSGLAEVVHLYFSDPWPKSRHHKRRVVQDSFLATVYRILKPGGELRIVTDHLGYWSWMEEHFDRWCAADHEPRFARCEFVTPQSAGDGEVVGTNFERKYREEGRVFNAATLVKAGTD
ncbi:MAG: tRNA (guanosine(46)-N7)-methyltransferase TrmB [Planctomycetota bacterium]